MVTHFFFFVFGYFAGCASIGVAILAGVHMEKLSAETPESSEFDNN